MLPTSATEPRVGLRLVSVAELLQLPDPNWLVAGLLEERRFGVLFGPPGSGKTFVAADLAFAISTGLGWHGRRVEQGPILYVAAEGQTGISKRTEAWLREHHMDASAFRGVHFVLEAIDLRNASHIDWVVRAVSEHGIKLVVFDTLAHCAPGVDENAVRDMQEVVGGVHRITAAGAAVLALHHSTKANAERERGSGALRAAADVMLAVKGEHGRVVLRNDKQKDEEQTGDLMFRLQRIELRQNAQGVPVTSCVLVAADASLGPPTAGADNAAMRKIVGVLQAHPAGLPNKALVERTGLPQSTFNRTLKDLSEAGRVSKAGGTRGVWQLVAASPAPSTEGYPEPLAPAA
jgi:hypothetical protein